MKRRKKAGAPIGHASKSPHAASKHAAPDDILPILTEQAGQAEIREKAVAAGARRRNGKSRQPPLSEEMKTVTEIGSRRWKPGQTQ
jgi:hypothetical protein